MNKPLHYFERTGLFMHGMNTHGCESWKLIGECDDKQFHKFVDTLTDWRKERKLPPIQVKVVRVWFEKFMKNK